MAEVLRHLAPTAERVVCLAVVRLQDLGRCDADGERRREVAVVEAEPVLATAELSTNGELAGLVAGGADVEESLSLLEQRQHLVVQLARQHHGAQRLPEFVGGHVGGRERRHVQVALDLDGRVVGGLAGVGLELEAFAEGFGNLVGVVVGGVRDRGPGHSAGVGGRVGV